MALRDRKMLDWTAEGDEFNFEPIDPEAVAAVKAQQKSSDAPINKLADQILGQGLTKQWSGQGFGSPESNAKDMAKILNSIGITDIKQFGTWTVEEDGVPRQVFGNKETKQAVPSTYASDPTAWGGTYAGKGNTGYRVQFGPDGTPYFYTTSASSSDLADIAPLLGLGASLLLPGLGSALASGLGVSAGVGSALAGGLTGGVLAEAQGGDFLKGALTGAIGSSVAPISSGISEAVGGGMLGNAIGQAATSAGMAALQGGDVGKAALLGGLSGAGKPIDMQTLVDADIAGGLIPEFGTNQAYDSFMAAAMAPQITAPVSEFKPDYGLTTGPAVLPEMGAQGLQVPPIEEFVPVGESPVDYSLPIPSSGLGLMMPTAPNIDAMGGGQGITVPVQGGLLTESGVIPTNYTPPLGDPNSFINQPAPESGAKIPEAVPETSAPTKEVAVPWGEIGKLLAGLFATSQLAKQTQPTPMGSPMTPYTQLSTTPMYDDDYYRRVQRYYNAYLPETPRDVITPLQQWYETAYRKG